jgi:hypothetical protein
VVCHLRLWDAIQWQLDLKDASELADLDDTFAKIKRISDLNRLRNQLVKEIDECLTR